MAKKILSLIGKNACIAYVKAGATEQTVYTLQNIQTWRDAKNHVDYLVAFCVERAEKRTFRVDRINAIIAM